MSLQLPSAPDRYDRQEQQQVRQLLQLFVRRLLQRGDDIDAGRIVRTSPNGSRWELGVDNAGNTTWTAL